MSKNQKRHAQTRLSLSAYHIVFLFLAACSSIPKDNNPNIELVEIPDIDNSILVSTVSDFELIRENPASAYRLANDIDFSSTNDFDPITADGLILNGAGFRILNFRTTGKALFTSLTNSEVKNIVFENASVVSAEFNTGLVAGKAINSTLSNIKILNSRIEATGVVNGVGSFAGLTEGFTQILDSQVDNSTIIGRALVGGIAGYLQKDAVVSNVQVNSSSILNRADQCPLSPTNTLCYAMGGIAGRADRSVIREAHVQNSTISGGTHVGGLVGDHGGAVNANGYVTEWWSRIEDSSVLSSRVEGVGSVGGLVGVHRGVYVHPDDTDGPAVIKRSSIIDSVVHGRFAVGGLAGKVFGGSITDSIAEVGIELGNPVTYVDSNGNENPVFPAAGRIGGDFFFGSFLKKNYVNASFSCPIPSNCTHINTSGNTVNILGNGVYNLFGRAYEITFVGGDFTNQMVAYQNISGGTVETELLSNDYSGNLVNMDQNYTGYLNLTDSSVWSSFTPFDSSDDLTTFGLSEAPFNWNFDSVWRFNSEGLPRLQ